MVYARTRRVNAHRGDQCLTLPPYTIDAWTLTHALGWAWIGAAAFLYWRASLGQVLLLGLVTGLAWELAEAGLVEDLLTFREPIVNRTIDVLVDVLGAVAGWYTQRRLMLRITDAG